MVLTVPPSLAHHPADPVAAPTADHDRRRRGRTSVNPVLIPLMRGTAGGDDAADQDNVPAEEDWRTDRSNFARCLFFMVLLAVPSWGIIGAICYWVTH